jgi:PleD family two-component response regulator
MAERVRKAFAQAEAFVAGPVVNCTVSGGVASSATPLDINALLREADACLYRAKSLGRDRIERFDAACGTEAAANIIRVA